MPGILLNGVSTRRYERVIPEMADTYGIALGLYEEYCYVALYVCSGDQ